MSTTPPRTTLLMRLAVRQQRRLATSPRRRRYALPAAAAAGVLAITGVAAAFWTTNGSGSGQAQAATVSNLTISAVASPAPGHLLYPGNTGDAVLKITNSNSFPVTITAVTLPSSTTYGPGYSSSTLTAGSAIAACSSSGGTASLVAWNFASNAGSHTLTSPLTVGANSSLTVSMTNDATMGLLSPAACEGAYFQLPALTAVTATSSTSTATANPATDAWTN